MSVSVTEFVLKFVALFEDTAFNSCCKILVKYIDFTVPFYVDVSSLIS